MVTGWKEIFLRFGDVAFITRSVPLSRNEFLIYSSCPVGITYRDKSNVPGLNSCGE